LVLRIPTELPLGFPTLLVTQSGRVLRALSPAVAASDRVRLMRRGRRRLAPGTCLVGIDCGEQLLHSARCRCAERLVEVDRHGKLLTNELIAASKFSVARERLLDAIGVAAA